jgi:two-component system, sensor histidine kinase LadS
MIDRRFTFQPTLDNLRLAPIWYGLFLALSMLAALPAHASDYIAERAWVEDSSGELTRDEVARRMEQRFEGALAKGYGSSAIWVRIRVDPNARPPSARMADNLILRVRPAYLDEVLVFDPLAADAPAGVLGDRSHPREAALQSADFLLPLARGEAARDIWLRVTSTSTRLIDVTILDLDDLGAVVAQQQLLSGVWVGLLLGMVIWALANWYWQGNLLMGAFGVEQAAVLAFALTSLGLLRTIWPSDWSAASLDFLGSVFSVAGVTAAAVFHWLFLREICPGRWTLGLLRTLPMIGLANFVLLSLGEVRAALQVNMLLTLVCPLTYFVCAALSRAWDTTNAALRPPLPRLVVIAFYGLILLVMLTSSGAGLALSPAYSWTIYASMLHAVITGLLMLIILQYRALVINQRRLAAELKLARASEEARHERIMREEQEKLLTMLTHEIKTPLATMHMRLDASAPGSTELRQAMREMNQVVDRCLTAAQIGDGKLPLQFELHNLQRVAQDAASAAAEPERIHLDFSGPCWAITDRQLLSMVLSNLLENACKYSPPGSPIELAGGQRDDPELGAAIVLEVRNQPGSSGAPDPARVFEKYYRSPHARRISGTGLGLYLVKRLVATLQGRIEYAREGEQIRFVTTLPVAPLLTGSPRSVQNGTDVAYQSV